MGRVRQAITLNRLSEEGDKYFVRLRHPILKKIVCFSLGRKGEVQDNLEKLNTIFLNPDNWLNPPKETPHKIREQWLGPEGIVKLRGNTISKAGKQTKPDSAETARLLVENEALRLEREQLLQRIEAQARELEALRGKKYQKGLYPTLKDAIDTWLNRYKGRDKDHANTVAWDLRRFEAKFGGSERIDKLEGREGEINAWIRSLENRDGKPLSGSRRMQIRLYVLKMLTDNGIQVDRNKLDRVTRKDIRKSRGSIRWLTRVQAEALAGYLKAPWADMFRVQCAIGLRPDELLTLHRRNFNADLSSLNLEPLKHLTLKTGSREIPIPRAIRPIIELRLRQNEVVFPEPETGQPWHNPKNFNRRYKEALEAAVAKTNALPDITKRINIAVDSRIGRRTCASMLIQDNVSAEKVAKLLGNTPGMVLEHYGDPDVKKIDLSVAVLSA